MALTHPGAVTSFWFGKGGGTTASSAAGWLRLKHHQPRRPRRVWGSTRLTHTHAAHYPPEAKPHGHFTSARDRPEYAVHFDAGRRPSGVRRPTDKVANFAPSPAPAARLVSQQKLIAAERAGPPRPGPAVSSSRRRGQWRGIGAESARLSAPTRRTP